MIKKNFNEKSMEREREKKKRMRKEYTSSERKKCAGVLMRAY